MNYDEIVRFYRGWYEYEIKASGFDSAKYILIDDLAPKKIGKNTFKSENEIAHTLHSLIFEHAQKTNAKNANAMYGLKKLEYSLSYLEQKRNKKQTDHLRIPEFIDIEDSLISDSYQYLNTLRNELTPEFRSRENLDLDELINLYNTFPTPYIKGLCDLLGVETDLSFQIKTVHSNAHWRNMVTHEDDSLVLYINTNKDIQYSKPVATALSIHEICGHIFHLHLLKGNNFIQNNYPHLACIAIHTLDSYYTEGIAQMLSNVILKYIDPNNIDLLHSVRELEFTFAVKYRNITKLLNQTIKFDQAVDFHMKYLSGKKDDTLQYYTNITKDPFFSSQILNYHLSLNRYNSFMNTMNPKDLLNIISGEHMFDYFIE